MMLDVSQVLRYPGEVLTRDFELSLKSLEEWRLAGTVRGHIQVANTGRHIVMTGTVEGTVELACSRCLASTQEAISAPIEEYCDLGYFFGERDDSPADVEEAVAALFEGLNLDLDELARQMLLVHVPMQPLCAPTCLGLCPTCGRNLNQEQCTCVAESSDPRLSVLARLLDSQ